MTKAGLNYTSSNMKISVVGLGKLGLPFVASTASRGFSVYGVDTKRDIISALNSGKTFLKEPEVQELIKKFKNKIKATTNTKKAVLNSDISFIVTPTPSKTNGEFSLRFVKKAIKDITAGIKLKKTYHLVVIVSTVMPGSTDKARKLLEKYTGKVSGEDFGVCYSPEFIALGNVINDLLKPGLVLIGQSDKKAGDLLQKFYKRFCLNKPNIKRMNFENAELTKIAINTFVTTKISYANMLAEICEKLPGGDVDTVTQALGLDSRIGQKYLKGGTSFGGPCFPRDNIAFMGLAKRLRSSYQIPLATIRTNLRNRKRLVSKTLKYAKKGSTVGILGLSYKPFTDVIEESAGLFLSQALIRRGVQVNLHDPWALENVKEVIKGGRVKYFENLKDCIEASDVLVITTNWPEYKSIKPTWLGNRERVLIDPWRLVDKNSITEKIKYVPFGRMVE